MFPEVATSQRRSPRFCQCHAYQIDKDWQDLTLGSKIFDFFYTTIKALTDSDRSRTLRISLLGITGQDSLPIDEEQPQWQVAQLQHTQTKIFLHQNHKHQNQLLFTIMKTCECDRTNENTMVKLRAIMCLGNTQSHRYMSSKKIEKLWIRN